MNTIPKSICLLSILFVYQLNAQTISSTQIIIKWQSQTHTSIQLSQEIGAEVIRKFPLLQMEVWTLPQEYELTDRWLCTQEAFLQYIQQSNDILYAEPNYTARIRNLPDDPSFLDQWSLSNMGDNACPEDIDINILAAWEKTVGSDSVLLGMIDSGIDWTHPDLVNNIWQNLKEDADGDGHTLEWNENLGQWILDPGDLNGIDDDDWDNNDTTYVDDLIGWDFVNNRKNPMDEDGHGTHAASIAGASGNNGIGITGVNWNVSLLPLKALNENGIGQVSDLIAAIEYSVAQGVRITNNSWSMEGDYSLALYEAIQMAKDSIGQLFVTAAGNTESNNDLCPIYPASFDLPNIISVAASNCHDQRPSFSNYGATSVDIFAPGDGIYGALSGGDYGYKSGSSMAAPHVAGAAALMLAHQPGLSYETLKGKLLSNVREVPELASQCVSGGVLDVDGALSGTVLFGRGEDSWSLIPKRVHWTAVTEQGNYLWVGTDGGGLIRIDKTTYEQKRFDSGNSGLISNKITSLATDGDDLWVASYPFVGMCKYNGDNWTTYKFSSRGNWHRQKTSIAVQDSGQIWTISLGNLYLFNGIEWEDFTHIIDFNGLYGEGVIPSLNEVFVDSSDNLWIASTSAMSKMNGLDSSWTTINLSDAMLRANVKTIEVGRNGNIWVGTKNGILVYNNTTNILDTLKTNSQFINTNEIEHITFALDSTVWLASDYRLFHLNETIVLDSMSSLNSPLIGVSFSEMWMDKENKLWFFSSISASIPPYFQTKEATNWNTIYQEAEIPAEGGVSFLTKDPQGNIWANPGTWEGLVKYDYDSWKLFESHDLGTNDPSSIAFDSAGYYWLRYSYDDLYKCLGTNCEKIELDFIRLSGLSKVLVLRNGEVMVGTRYGILVYNGNWTLYDSTNTNVPWTIIPNTNHIHPLMEDFEGNIWVKFTRAIPANPPSSTTYKWNRTNDTWEEVRVHDFFGGGLDLSDVIQAKDSSIWITNGTSIYKYQNDSINLYATSILGNKLAIDCNNHLWVVKAGSFNVLEPGLIKVTQEHVIKYDICNSSIGTNSTQSILIDKYNNIWLGTSDGLMVINPTTLVSFIPENEDICLNHPATFTNFTAAADSFHWEIDGQYVSSDTNLTHIFTTPGTHNVKLTAFTGSVGESYRQSVYVKPPPTVDLGPDIHICATSYYLNLGNAHWTYQWFDIEGNLLSERSYLLAGESDTYIVEIQDECGLSDRDTIQITFETNDIGSCVWPGDVDQNGWVNVLDYLILASLDGETGPARPNATSEWIGQPLADWGRPITHRLATGIDMKNADCDGDGIIDLAKDGAVLLRNAHGGFPQQIHESEGGLQLRAIPRQREIVLGDSLHIDFSLYDALGRNVEDFYGFAFTMTYNMKFQTIPTLKSDPSWLGTHTVDFEQGVIKHGREVDYVFSRKDGNAVRGSGRVTVAKHPRVGRNSDTSRYVRRIFLTANISNSIVLNPDGDSKPINILGASSLETVTINIPWVFVDLKANLQGAWDQTLGKMHTALNDSGYIPLLHPYKDLYQPRPDSIPSNVVDWVWVELRDGEDAAKIVNRRAAWLTKDRKIIDPEGGQGLAMQAREGKYFIVVGHRNHLPIRSKVAISLSETEVIAYDFITPEAVYGENTMVKLDDGIYGMYSGDVNRDGRIAYTGNANDVDAMLSVVGVNDPTSIVKGYFAGDLNMDGKVQFSGLGNDRSIILINLGGDRPEDVIRAQLE